MFAIVINIPVFCSPLVVQRAAMCNPAACLLPKLLRFAEPSGAVFPALLTASPVDQSMVVAQRLSWEAARDVCV